MSRLLTTVSRRGATNWTVGWRNAAIHQQYRSFAETKKPKYEIPQHLVRKGKRRIPEAYIRVLKQVPPRQYDYFGKGMIWFIVIFSVTMNGIYIWQGYTLKDRLKNKGIIEGDNDEKWHNINKYTVN